MNLEDIYIGQRVRYIPSHARGDAFHKDCEDGIVRNINDKFVFVVYEK